MEKLDLLLTKGPRLVYCNFSLKEVPKLLKKGYLIECQYSFEIKVDSKKNEVLAALTAKSKSKNIPFNFDLKSEAMFKCKGSYPSDERAIVEAMPYVFPFVKEMVADLTRKAYLAPFYLPAIELKIENFEKMKK